MRIDMHTHTKHSSDGLSRPERIVKYAEKKGLDGVAITDHNTTRGWKKALLEGNKRDILVIQGEEIIVTSEGKKVGELLGYFLNEPIKPGPIEEVIGAIREQDGLISVSHPYDRHRGFKYLDSVATLVDAVEGFNARCFHQSFNTKAQVFAKKHNLAVTGGSDAHFKFEVGNAWTEAKASTLEDFRKAILKRKTTVNGKLSGPMVRAYSWMGRLRKF